MRDASDFADVMLTEHLTLEMTSGVSMDSMRSLLAFDETLRAADSKAMLSFWHRRSELFGIGTQHYVRGAR